VERFEVWLEWSLSTSHYFHFPLELLRGVHEDRAFFFGSITINGEEYSNDVVLLPPRIVSTWWRREGHRLKVDDLTEVVAYRPDAS